MPLEAPDVPPKLLVCDPLPLVPVAPVPPDPLPVVRPSAPVTVPAP